MFASHRGNVVGLMVPCFLVAACSKTPPEPEARRSETPAATSPAPSAAAPATQEAPTGEVRGVKGEDPLKGEFSLAQATKGIPGSGALVAKMETSKGTVQCKLYEDKAPVTVANFVGLASGTRPFRDPNTNEWVSRPAYDGTTFHRIIKGFMIQGGDAKGNGTGEPGYVIKDEVWAGAKHDRAGLLCMANRGPNTNGAQFFITDASAPHLDGGYTIFGECSPESVVHDIAGVPTGPGDRPTTAVTIKSVKIAREKS